jgi:hypothetical protein
MRIIRPEFKQYANKCAQKAQRMHAKSIDKCHALKPDHWGHFTSKKALHNLINAQSKYAGKILFENTHEMNAQNVLNAKNTTNESIDINKDKLQTYFQNNIHYDVSEHASKYPYMHSKYGMHAMRKMGKAVIPQTDLPMFHTLKFSSKDILRLISYIDIDKINVCEGDSQEVIQAKTEQKEYLQTITTLAQNNTFSDRFDHNIIDEIVHELEKFPICADMELQAKHDYDAQTQIELGRAKQTTILTKATEIASYNNKQLRHKNQYALFEKEMISIVCNLHKQGNFDKFIDLCSTPAFRHSVVLNPDLGIIMKYAFTQAKKEHPEEMNAILQTFRDRYSMIEDSTTHCISLMKKPSMHEQEKIDTYCKFLNATTPLSKLEELGLDADANANLNINNNDNNDDCIEEWLKQGSLAYEKQCDKEASKRAGAQGFSAAILFACFAISALRMSILRALIVVPPIVFAFKFGISGVMMKHKGKFAENMYKYWQEHPEYGKNGCNLSNKKRKFKNTVVVAKSLVQPVTSGLIITGVSLGLRLGVVAALGNKAGAILFGALSGASFLTITPLAYLSEKQQRRQHSIEKLLSV